MEPEERRKMLNDVGCDVTAGLVDDIADIYADINVGIILYEHRHEEAVREWGFPLQVIGGI